MTNKLHVANLGPDTTEDELRAHFGTCGGVLDVEIVFDRRTHSPRGLACVTMTSPASAEVARSRLDGVALGGRQLRVTDTREPIDPAAKVKIAQQFREPHHSTYDVDCEGTAFTICVIPILDGRWRIEARATNEAATVISSCGASKRDVLWDVLRAWNSAAHVSSSFLPKLDDAAVMQAMREIRAV